ncbi:MAG: 2-oxoacid:ferredoxin oxidoreductase subunit beta [Theionarchaea archaeon]|nr:2-oxoacid:ferredoxin oxidoreductase subunit beta [Theionarchaea archaeon]
MITNTLELREEYLRKSMFPSIFCTGCGIGNVLHYTIQAIDNVGLDMTKTVFVSGIGCSSRLPGYVRADGLHTTHGRALAFATGIHAANPELDIVVFTGDGDCVGIGGNHFIHAIRRNINVTVIAVNNFNYGMTGGQVAPTTPRHAYTTTSPHGNVEHPFDMSRLAVAAGAPYVARWTVTHPYRPIRSIEKGLKKNGFAFIEMLSPCPTAYGRRNKLRDIEEMWNWYKENVVLLEDYERIMKYGTEEEKSKVQEKMTIGEFCDYDKPEFMDEWNLLVERLRK